MIDDQRDRIFTNIWNAYGTTEQTTYVYLLWMPTADMGQLDLDQLNMSAPPTDLPFVDVTHSDTNATIGLMLGEMMEDFRLEVFLPTSGPMSFFVAVMPGFFQMEFHPAGNETPALIKPRITELDTEDNCIFRTIHHLKDQPANLPSNESVSRFQSEKCPSVSDLVAMAFKDATLTRCDLLNTSYTATFNYTDNRQSVDVKYTDSENSKPLQGSGMFVTPSSPGQNCSGFQGSSIISYFGDGMEAAASQINCTFDLGAVDLLSYQGIMGAFNQFIIGAVEVLGPKLDFEKTSIHNTILGMTHEISTLREIEERAGSSNKALNSTSLQVFINNSTNPTLRGLQGELPPAPRPRLKDTLPQLFLNYTLSILSEPLFHPNESSPFAISPLANVTVSG